ncbi:probable purple acid phosphatase 20 [Macadamia integrifolia]|uniref:probable purple acid phosphatase 20 n=1 Tax=Macadamia integrifolia TaxID=60698 RepID=UPI001C4F2F25|nr:probable purple acid phosphatase 20 [Macadamia integrifolia]
MRVVDGGVIPRWMPSLFRRSNVFVVSAWWSTSMAIRVFFVALMFWLVFAGYYRGVLSYNRPPARQTLSILPSLKVDRSSPQQVHISLVGSDKMRISWITEDFGTPSTVQYGTSSGMNTWVANGTTNSYKYLVYESGEIHEVIIGPLKPDTSYYYRCGLNNVDREFTFKTPPAQFPIKFAVVGDLGQTEWTQSTLDHISGSKYDVLLLPGDLSYADMYQPRWDSFGQLVEPLASQRPWMVSQGNHEVEKIPIIHPRSFTSYNTRWRMPYEESGSDSNLYYSFEVAGVHVLMLGSYTDFEAGTSQYNWLQADLAKVDRKKTPWLVALVHAPWYNSNTAHQGEYQSYGMRAAMEGLLYDARVDVVFAGHVHAYERFTRVHKGQANNCGPVHITIGDGGNREGLANKYIDPHPKISVFREASFGHGELQVMNESYALWSWHRNDDDEPITADSVWLRSLTNDPACKKV